MSLSENSIKKTIREAVADEREAFLWDDKPKGLFFRVKPSGVASFGIQYRVGSETRRVKIGRWPVTTIPAARTAAHGLLQEIGKGGDPSARRREERQQLLAQQTNPDTLEAVIAKFIDRRRKDGQKSILEVEKMLARYVAPALGKRPIADLRRRDFIDLIEHLHDNNGGATANRVLSQLRAICRWAVSRDYLAGDPTALVAKPHKEQPRQRILSDREIRAVWNACEALGTPWRALVQLLLLTGQRLREAAGMRWDEIDEAARVWTLPAPRAKTGQPNEVPLSDAAWAIIASMPRKGPYVLTTDARGATPLAGFTHPKVALAARISEIDPQAMMGQWQFHDLRRTFRTRLSALGISSEIAERCIGHQPSGIQGVYDVHRYTAQKRIAMDAWATALVAIVSGKPAPSNVVTMQAAG